MSDVHVLRAVLVRFAGVPMCTLGGARVEAECHDEMMNGEQQAEVDVSFLGGGESVYMAAVYGSSDKRRVIQVVNTHVTDQNMGKYSSTRAISVSPNHHEEVVSNFPPYQLVSNTTIYVESCAT